MTDAIETLRLLISDAAEAFGEVVADETVALDRLEALVRAAEAVRVGLAMSSDFNHLSYTGRDEIDALIFALRAVKGEQT